MGESEPTKNLLKSFLQYPLPQTGHFLRFVASIDQTLDSADHTCCFFENN